MSVIKLNGRLFNNTAVMAICPSNLSVNDATPSDGYFIRQIHGVPPLIRKVFLPYNTISKASSRSEC